MQDKEQIEQRLLADKSFQHITKFMESLGFEWLNEELQWYRSLPHQVGDFKGIGRGQYIHPELARFLHDAHLAAVAEAVIDELKKLHRYDGKDHDTELDELIDERVEELEAQLAHPSRKEDV